MRMIHLRGRTFWKYFAYFVLLLLAAVLQSTPNFFSIAGVQPVLVIPVVVLIAMTEPIIPAAVFGLLGGLFLDAGSLSIFGLFGFEFLFLATFANLFVTVILNNAMPFSVSNVADEFQSPLTIAAGFVVIRYGSL